MVKRLAALLCVLLLAQPAITQSYDGPGAQTPDWSTAFVANTGAVAADSIEPTPANEPARIIFEGDSITNGSGLTSWATGWANDNPTRDASNYAEGGSIVSNGGDPDENCNGRGCDIRDVDRVNRVLDEMPSHVVFLIGANDLANTAIHADTNDFLADVYAAAATYRAAHRAKVYVGTILPLCDTTYVPGGALHNGKRATVNAALRAAVGNQIDGVIDFAANTTIGDDADACNTTYYSDGLHPTQAGQNVMKGVAQTALATALAGYPTTFKQSQWIEQSDPSNYLTAAGRERKFRITCEPSVERAIDTILFFGNNGPVGHRHQFTGAVDISASATYGTLRTSPSSTCAGGPLNPSNYWEPAMLTQLSTGVVVSVRQQADTFYYLGQSNVDQALLATWLRFNMGFISGANPNNYNDTAMRAEYAAAGLLYPGSTDTPAGFGGWQCIKGGTSSLATVTHAAARMKTRTGASITTSSRYLKGPGGEDPWGGECRTDAGQPAELVLTLYGPNCWDGKNLRAPTGREHVRFSSFSADNSITDRCPYNWVYQPQLEGKKHYYTSGFADYGTWYLSSDRMNAPGTPGDPTSLDPCRQTGPYFCPGSTAHFDLITGWHPRVFVEWQRECLGIPVYGVAPRHGPAECAVDTVSKNRSMRYGGASPDTNYSGGCATLLSCSNAVPGNTERYNPPENGTPVPGPIQHRH